MPRPSMWFLGVGVLKDFPELGPRALLWTADAVKGDPLSVTLYETALAIRLEFSYLGIPELGWVGNLQEAMAQPWFFPQLCGDIFKPDPTPVYSPHNIPDCPWEKRLSDAFQ